MLAIVPRSQTQFIVGEAGCLIYLTDRSVIAGTAGEGPVTGGELYQDDGFCVRVLLGELTPEEQVNWTSRIVSELQLPTGEMIVSGILDPDYDRWLSDFGVADLELVEDVELSGDHELGCIVNIEPGAYVVELYSYPPNDLAAGWMKIEDRENFDLATGSPVERDAPTASRESAQEYFERTRPGEPVPEWIAEGYEDAEFLDFVIRLERIGEADAEAAASAGQQFLDWEFRKPEVCPVGIRL
ncbi:MAG: hypothetical protein ACRDKE_04160 [Solirubrobacterales bacterium]